MASEFIPISVGDYFAETMHLTAAEHGAFMMLIIHIHQHGALPDDDKRLCAITKMKPKAWRYSKATLLDLAETISQQTSGIIPKHSNRQPKGL